MKHSNKNRNVCRCGFLFWAVLILLLSAASVSAGERVVYRDPAERFAFEYPEKWGQVTRGTNDGFGDRVAARRFSRGPGGRLGGEAVLTRGRVMVDIQALGGLYDSISLEMLPAPVVSTVMKGLPKPTAKNFCRLLGQESHLDTAGPSLKSLKPQLREAISGLDSIRNLEPKVIECTVRGDTVTFHKETTFRAGKMEARQHIYGAIRFLKGHYSSFQLVQGDIRQPARETLSAITAVVKSFKTR